MKSREEKLAYNRGYQKKWRELNKERALEIQTASRIRNKEQIKLYKISYYSNEENRKKARETSKSYYKKNTSKVRKQISMWQKLNPEKMRSIWNYNSASYRAKKHNATPSWRNTFFISEAFSLARLRTKLTGIKHHVDHIVPIKSKLVCGLHNEFNIRVITAHENVVKGNFSWPDMPTLEA